MNDKIRWFKAFYRLDRFTNPNEPYLPSATDISYDDLLWLVEQAEIAERLRNENKKLTRIAIEADEGCEYWKDKYKQAQAKAERLENAIKETLETLKRGGPGTRSQVQQLLEKALEGEE
ncbi:hypothetical protein QT236_14515 [Geobacillus stearothermophilus]|nr:hypothetical protein QT236_12675 [Geobacillus stearothermophilus]WJQ03232.1 hypothetical protein QT236_14515 [Geobacillus stearothermophilus]